MKQKRKTFKHKAKILAFAFVCANPLLATTQYWAQGVNKDSGWGQDYQQVGDYCWSHVSAALIWWWQKNSTNLPQSNAPTTEEDILKAFMSNFKSEGKHIDPALSWYFSTYYPTLNYSAIHQRVDMYNVTHTHKDVSNIYYDLLNGKGVPIGITYYGHAITIWGAEFESRDYITKIFGTDSNNGSPVGTLEEYMSNFVFYNGNALYPLGFQKQVCEADNPNNCKSDGAIGTVWYYDYLNPIDASKSEYIKPENPNPPSGGDSGADSGNAGGSGSDTSGGNQGGADASGGGSSGGGDSGSQGGNSGDSSGGNQSGGNQGSGSGGGNQGGGGADSGNSGGGASGGNQSGGSQGGSGNNQSTIIIIPSNATIAAESNPAKAASSTNVAQINAFYNKTSTLIFKTPKIAPSISAKPIARVLSGSSHIPLTNAQDIAILTALAQNDVESADSSATASDFSLNLLDSAPSAELSGDTNVFITPFAGYTSSVDKGGYAGADYGVIAGIQERAKYHTLGLHFGYSNANLSGKGALASSNISHMLNAGVHYALHLPYNINMRARGDFYYINNETLALSSAIKHNNIGYGASIELGKGFERLKDNGLSVLELSVSVEHLNLQQREISTSVASYEGNLYKLLYMGAGISYDRIYTSGLRLNAALGAKMLSGKPQSSSASVKTTNQTIHYSLSTDTFLAHINLGIGYALSESISINADYIGIYGDKSITNSAALNVKYAW